VIVAATPILRDEAGAGLLLVVRRDRRAAAERLPQARAEVGVHLGPEAERPLLHLWRDVRVAEMPGDVADEVRAIGVGEGLAVVLSR